MAPTGIAALNAGGVTIHSQFLLPPVAFLPDRFLPEDVTVGGKFLNQNILAQKHPLNSARRQVLRSIDLLVIDTLPIGLKMSIPVDLMVPIKIPIRSNAKIHFSGPMPVDAKIPIKLTIPVNIPLEETSLAAYFRKMAEGLRGLTNLSLE